ncbi:MAG: radical SAM protein [Clostridia bacterium]|nr:radical SAM protein [Clostridia bacterium]
MKCNLCPRKCNAERTESSNTKGYCKQPTALRIARAALHFWEEPIISGKNGSGTIFFSGCNLGCVYCQNAEISQKNKGKTITHKRLAEIFFELEQKGAHNINLVTPTHYTDAITRALDIYKPSIPIVYNSSGYDSEEQINKLEKYIDIFLFDFKYLDSERAKRYSFAPDYPFVVKRAIDLAYKQTGEAVIENGLMKRGVIIRHLLLPRATGEAIKIFDYVKENYKGAYFSLMSQYVPMNKALNDDVINRKITKREYEKVTEYIINSGFNNCFIQETNSADKSYIPPFDFEGI